MTLKELYTLSDSNLEEVLLRVPSEPLLLKLVKMFLTDESKDLLDKSIAEKNQQDAFRAVHTMKGVALSLGLNSLANPCKALTENLRPGTFGEGWEDNYKALCQAYTQVTSAIRQLDA